VARLCRKIWAPRCAQPSMPARSRADLATQVIEEPDAKPTCGASVRTNSRRHDDFGRPWRRYATTAAPTSDLPALAVNEQLAGTPVDIIEGERRDLVGPEAELGQQQQDGIVAPPHHCRSVAAVESLLHLSGGQVRWQAREPPAPYRRHATNQRARVEPPIVEVTEKPAQRRTHHFACTRAPIPSVASDVANHVLLTDFAQICFTGRAHLAQELADDRKMAGDRPTRQAALCPQIGLELLEDSIVRGERRRHRRCDRAFLAQHHQPSLECCPVSALDSLPSGSMPEVALDHMSIEIGQCAPTARDPTQEPADHIEATPRAEPSTPFLDETSAIALDEVSVRPASETPEQPASAQVLVNFHLPVLRC